MENQLLDMLMKFVLSALGVVGTYALARLSLFLEAKKLQVVASEGAINYNHALDIAKGLYMVLEQEFAGIAQAGLDKKAEMDSRLLEVFPQISAVELSAINKEIWSQINEKIITPILTPILTPVPVVVEVKVVPVIDPVTLPIEVTGIV